MESPSLSLTSPSSEAMARIVLSSLLFFILLHSVVQASPAINKRPSPSDFIVTSCRVTRYPVLCIQSLSGYSSEIRQSERQLAQTALSVSLASVRQASAFVARLSKARGLKYREVQAARDCVENMGDSVDRLSQSVSELGHLGRFVNRDFFWHMSNVQTWVSAALTDETTCLDGFGGRRMNGNLKTAIRRRVVTVAQVTSNALALVNRFAAKH